MKYNANMNISSTDLSVERFLKGIIASYGREIPDTMIDGPLTGSAEFSWVVDNDIVHTILMCNSASLAELCVKGMDKDILVHHYNNVIVMAIPVASTIPVEKTGTMSVDWEITPIN